MWIISVLYSFIEIELQPAPRVIKCTVHAIIIIVVVIFTLRVKTCNVLQSVLSVCVRVWVCVCVCVFVCLSVRESVTMITRNIEFWPSCAPEKGVCGGANFFGSALLQPARSVCVSPSAFSHYLLKWCHNTQETVQWYGLWARNTRLIRALTVAWSTAVVYTASERFSFSTICTCSRVGLLPRAIGI